MSGEKKFYPGELVFDRKRTDPTDDILVVTDADVGSLGDLSGKDYRLVKHNGTNKKLKPGPDGPLDDSTRVIEAAYVSGGDESPPVLGDQGYTFPEFRLETVVSEEGNAIDGHQPHQIALAEFYAELSSALRKTGTTVESPKDLKVLAMEARVDGKVIVRGEELS